MGIFYRYIASKFWPPFFFGMGIFAVLVFLGDMFDRLNQISRSSASMLVIIQYFLYTIPYWTLVITPVAILLAALFALSEMVNSGEWIGALASGYHPRQVLMPIVGCAVLVSCVNFALQETVSPRLHLRADTIFQRDIRGRKDWQHTVKQNVAIKAGPGMILSASLFDSGAGEMEKVVLDVASKGRIAIQANAVRAVWDAGHQTWVFEKGVRRIFTAQGEIKEEKFDRWDAPVSIGPKRLVVEKAEAEDMAISDLLRRIENLKKTNSPVTKERVYLQSKLAAPFNSIIICLLGIPFVMKVRRANRMVHFASALVITFVFWWVISIFQTAGEAAMVSPYTAAWAPVFIFGLISVVGIRLTAK